MKQIPSGIDIDEDEYALGVRCRESAAGVSRHAREAEWPSESLTEPTVVAVGVAGRASPLSGGRYRNRFAEMTTRISVLFECVGECSGE